MLYIVCVHVVCVRACVCTYLQVLQTLGTETITPSSAAQCVAYIACIELPHNEWLELLPTLLGNVTTAGSTDALKESSLEAIGYVCEETDSSVSSCWCTKLIPL